MKLRITNWKLWTVSAISVMLVLCALMIRTSPKGSLTGSESDSLARKPIDRIAGRIGDVSEDQRLDLLVSPADFVTVTYAELFDRAMQSTHEFLFGGLKELHDENRAKAIGRARLAKALDKLSAAFGDEAIGMAAGNSSSNQMLPDNLRELADMGSFRRAFEGGKITIFNDKKQAFFGAEIIILCMWASAGYGDELAQFLSARADMMPISKLDLIKYWGLRAGMGEIGPGPTRNYPSIESLMPYAQAQNPVYRLLALEALAKTLPSGYSQHPPALGADSTAIAHAKIPMLRLYKSDNNHIIIRRLIDIVAMYPNEEAKKFLASIYEQQLTLGEMDLASAAKAAITLIEQRKGD